MKPDGRFLAQDKEFWANIRIISQEVGYTARGTKAILVPSETQIRKAFALIHLGVGHLFLAPGQPTEMGKGVLDYFSYRADVLNNRVRAALMTKDEAALEFQSMFARLQPRHPVPMNKQKGDKRTPAYLTGMVNMLIEANIGAHACVFDPRDLTTVTLSGRPLRTFARRVDGAFPSTVNPIAVWEIKEYYSTTTFGSRVADGVYESLLDGLELEELWLTEKIRILHYLMVDDKYTWWECGRSYLCRIIDMLHMGYVDEVFFGRQVLSELPAVVATWPTVLSPT